MSKNKNLEMMKLPNRREEEGIKEPFPQFTTTTTTTFGRRLLGLKHRIETERDYYRKLPPLGV
jgi:hypothetical protein